MGNKDYVPSPDYEFDQWSNTLMSYLSSRYLTYNVPQEFYMHVSGLRNIWSEKYAAAIMPTTRTSAAIIEKKNARSALEKDIRQMVREYLNHNHMITESDREQMGLTIYKKNRTPVPPPTTAPECHIDRAMLRCLKIHFRDAGSKSRAKPPGIHGAEIKWGFSDSPDISANQLINSSFDTRSPLTLEFDQADRGKYVYFCLRWENTRGEKGPWGEIANAIVP